MSKEDVAKNLKTDIAKFHIRQAPNCSNCRWGEIDEWNGEVMGCSKIRSIRSYNMMRSNGLVGENMVCDLYEAVNDDLCGLNKVG